MIQPKVYQKQKMYYIEILMTLLELFGTHRSHLAPHAVIQLPHSDSAPRELCPPYAPDAATHSGFTKLLRWP